MKARSVLTGNYVGSFPTQVDGLTRGESANLLQWFHDMITHGHDLQVRFKWNSPNDIGKCLCTIPGFCRYRELTGGYSNLGQSQRIPYRDRRPRRVRSSKWESCSGRGGDSVF
jgi:hypothetical protein